MQWRPQGPALLPLLRSIALALPLLAALTAPAAAHRLSPGYFGLVETAPNRYEATWKISVSGGLADVLVPEIPDACVVPSEPRVDYVDGVGAPRDFRVQHATLLCTAPLAGSTFSIGGLESTDTDVLLSIVYTDGSAFSHRLLPSSPSVVIPERPGVLDVVATYTMLGVEHILIGVDHLLFVFALLLLVDGWRRLVWTITAFTLAHSITLAAATLDLVRVSGAAVEATIALSILFLATELARRRLAGGRAMPVAAGGAATRGPAAAATAPDLAFRYPWVVAFAFGLLHGFGFAGALAEIGLPAQSIPLALLFFNIGVELGQLLFIGAAISLGYLLTRSGGALPRWSSRAAAYVIGSLAAFWVFERTLSAF